MRVKSYTENLAKKNRNKSAVHSSHSVLNVADLVKKENNIDYGEIESLQDEETLSHSLYHPNCQHLNKAVNNLNFLKKNLKPQTIGQCASCIDLKHKGNEIQVKKETTVWLCLTCGHQGCDRSSEHQHAIKHYMTPRSTLHCIVLNIDSFILWCYKCDEEIRYGKRVEEIVTSIKKIFTKESHFTKNDRSSSEDINKVDQLNSIPKANLTRANQHNFIKKQDPSLAIMQNIITNSFNNPSVNGLHNLGNTCFFNAVIQNLAQTPNLDRLLFEAINNKDKNEIIQSTCDYDCDSSKDFSECEVNFKKDDDFDYEINKAHTKKINPGLNNFNKIDQLSIYLNDAGAMTYNLFNLIREMNSLRSSISPGALFSLICKKVPSFKGFQEQDSHEMLRHLLDAIKNEEIKRRQLGILNAFNYDSRHPDDTVKQKIKNYGRLINYTCIDSLFGGHLLSTVLCEECKTCSQNIEPFLDLSLPIVDDKTVSNKISSIEDFNEFDGYLSKNKLKKQRKLSKKNKSKNQARTKSASKHLNEEDLLQTNVSKQQINSSNNLIVTVSDDDQEEVNVVEINNNDNTIETDENDSNKTVYITSSLNDALIQNDVLNNNFKLEAMQSLAKRSVTSIAEDDDINCSLQSFLLKFTSPEFLTGNNKFGCENCTRSSYRKLNSNNANCVPKDFKTIYTQAVKQYLICELPAILTIHLKRFQQHGFRLEKVNEHVNFPLELDMAPYTSKMCNNLQGSGKVIYSLYGVVEHSGRLNGGHYTAYIKSRPKQNLEKLLGKKRLTDLKPTVNTSDTLANLVETEVCTNNNESTQSTNASTWYYISDTSVSEVPESKILKSQAYILFYERVSII